MVRRRHRARVLCIGLAALAVAAQAVVPPPERVAGAIAEANRAAGRVLPLRIEVELQLEQGPPMTGVLVSHPALGARLEVRDPVGSVELHGLQGGSYTMTRDGRPQEIFHRVLPPLFLLQAGSGMRLREQLHRLGADARRVRLGRLGDRDCYVLGDGVDSGAPGNLQAAPSLWTDARTHEALRVLTREGIEYRLGPETPFQTIRLPAWIEILEPGGFRARLELRTAAPVPLSPTEPERGENDTGAGDRAISE